MKEDWYVAKLVLRDARLGSMIEDRGCATSRCAVLELSVNIKILGSDVISDGTEITYRLLETDEPLGLVRGKTDLIGRTSPSSF